MNRTRILGRLFSLLAALALAAGVLALTPGVVGAADPSYPAPSPTPVASYGEPGPGLLVTDVRVITGDNPYIDCPAGYTKRFPDLNMGLGTQLNGQLSDYVYTCLRFQPAANLNGANPGIGELYISSPVTAYCNGDDRQVNGDLNSGMVRFDVISEEELFYCIHQPGTNGGSGYVIDPGVSTTYFPTPQNKLLNDVQFLAWDPPSVPTCVTTDCVDTSPVGAFAYLEAAKTYDPYCQQFFGPNYHPLFQPWEYYYSSGDQDTAVPQDANAFDLNAGVFGKTMIYACGSYITPDTTPPTLTAAATTADGRAYTANTWTNQDVTVTFTCADNAGGTGVASVSPPRTISGGGNLPVSGSCADHANNIATVNFGPILIDQTPPRITATATTADGQPYTAGAWTNQAVTVHFSCAEDAAASYISGVATDTVAGATVSGEGANQSVTSTGTCADVAGNVTDPVSFGPINIDQTKPVITARATTADGQPYTPGVWTNQHVTVAFACADTGAVQSGLATNTLTNQTLSTDGANLAVTNTGTCVDQAGNTAEPVTLSGIKLDQTPPQISVTAPTATTYLLHQVVTTGYACADLLADGATPGSGVAACAGSVANGGALDTASVGTKTFTVTAQDAVGNTASQSVTYTVAYNICVLYDQTQAHKAGSAVPIKLALCDAGGANISADTIVVTAIGLTQVSTDASSTVVDAGDANPDDNFRYAGGSYLYNLKTTGLTTGTWQLTFTVAGDPSTHSIQFQVR
jgi:hypothetical protein